MSYLMLVAGAPAFLRVRPALALFNLSLYNPSFWSANDVCVDAIQLALGSDTTGKLEMVASGRNERGQQLLWNRLHRC
jgi:hypothetical protein